MEEEIWKDIEGFDNYQISNLCRVKNVKFNRFVKPLLGKHGYVCVNLYKDGKLKHLLLHRLLALAFIPNPENKPCIDHINTDRTDNRIENLRWATQKENHNNPLSLINHANASRGRVVSEEQKKRQSEKMKGRFKGVRKFSKKIIQLTLDGNFVREWDSIKDAADSFGVSSSAIWNCLNGKCQVKSIKGFIWKYKKETD